MTTRSTSTATSPTLPGPREALDVGTLHDLWLAGAEVRVDVTTPRDRRPTDSDADTVLVPERASSLVGSWDGFGV